MFFIQHKKPMNKSVKYINTLQSNDFSYSAICNSAKITLNLHHSFYMHEVDITYHLNKSCPVSQCPRS